MIDRAVMIGVDLVEARAEAAVAIGLRQPGEPIIVRFRLFQPGPLARLQIGGGQLRGELGLAALDKAQPPVAVLLKVIGSSAAAGRAAAWVSLGAAGCAAWLGSPRPAAITAEAARSIHFIGFSRG